MLQRAIRIPVMYSFGFERNIEACIFYGDLFEVLDVENEMFENSNSPGCLINLCAVRGLVLATH